LAKLLAMIQLTLKGTPFIYQGQEIGSINHSFQNIGQMRDVESINLYQELLPSLGEEATMKKVLSGSRDHSRIPMQWNDTKNAGFTEGTPWIPMDDDYKEWNVEKQLQEQESIYHFYKQLIQLRKEHGGLIYGEFEPVNGSKKNLFAFYRRVPGDVYYVECNLSSKPMKIKPKANRKLILSNYKDHSEVLKPYEANLYRCVNY